MRIRPQKAAHSQKAIPFLFHQVWTPCLLSCPIRRLSRKDRLTKTPSRTQLLRSALDLRLSFLNLRVTVFLRLENPLISLGESTVSFKTGNIL